ncbi:hypothetical protein MNV49_006458 [Pseudohyphozyma bogoriensis]|nr:hypothetical protein MNV49_006458 [Pseudohyphozyma bogoriensis]
MCGNTATTPQQPNTSTNDNAREDPAALGLRAGLTNYGDYGFSLFLRKAFIKGAGYTDDALDRKIVGVIDTGSGYNPCHGNMVQLIDAVSRGVMLSGALPIKFPTISIHEAFSSPTSMFLRNLMSMDTEEMLRAQPMDAVVLIGGCDKTVPAQLMGAISAGLPAIQLVVGPMVTGSHRGVRVGACTDCRGYWGKHRAGIVDIEEISQVGNELVPGVGTCGVMGTASTMACVTEALGLIPIGGASPPANSSARLRVAEQTDFDRIGRKTPLLVDLKPSGDNYMEDFHKAGGMPALFTQLAPLLHLDQMTVTGLTLGEEIARLPPAFDQSIIRPLSNPLVPSAALAVLRGNLSPNGCIIKQSAMSPALRQHVGKAVVFTSAKDLTERIDSPDLEVDKDSVLVLQNIGPVGNPGMPEAGYIPIPKKLARAGVTDMVRISDGRMSGTASGAVILHVSPEAAVGGPLGIVRNGDVIELDVEERKLHLQLSNEEIQARLEGKEELGKEGRPTRGYRRLYVESVLQAHRGADFDFLTAKGA